MRKTFKALILLSILPFAACSQVDTCSSFEHKDKPEIIHAGMATPDVILLTVRAQWEEYGIQVPYKRQSGDSIQMFHQHRFVIREGERIGSLVGKEGRILYIPNRRYGDNLDTQTADQVQSYRISNPGNKQGVQSQAVFRKSKSVDFIHAPGENAFAMEHTIILKMGSPLQAGMKYTVHFNKGMLASDKYSFIFNHVKLRSEAVHVNQVGYRPDDPVKVAFLSFWMDSGGGFEYPNGCTVRIMDDITGEEVFFGKAVLAKTASDPGNKIQLNN